MLKILKGKIRCIVALFTAVSIISANGIGLFADEPANLTVKSIANVNVRIYGFVETDFISDSTMGIYEEPDNPTVAKGNTYNGSHGQTMMSVRNSRLGFDLTMPDTDFGLKSEAIFEMDFMGNQAANTKPANTSAATQTERDFFNNPTYRIRHAYLNLTYEDLNAKFGQTWSLLGWQPYYFPSEPIVQPAVGQLYRRFTQMRVTKTRTLDNLGLADWQVECAADIAKPAEMASDLQEYHAGVRLSSTKCKAASGLGSGDSMTGLSLAGSWAWIPGIQTQNTIAQDGYGYAVDLLVPIIPSSDGKDMSNNLSLTAEYSMGSGIGGLEVAGASGNISAYTDKNGTQTIDSGIAGKNLAGAMELIQLETERANLTYVMPNPKWAIAAGYAQTRVDNIGDFGNSSSSLVQLYQYYYGALYYTPVKWLRWGLEYAEFHDAYQDTSNAQDNRIQLTTYVRF